MRENGAEEMEDVDEPLNYPEQEQDENAGLDFPAQEENQPEEQMGDNAEDLGDDRHDDVPYGYDVNDEIHHFNGGEIIGHGYNQNDEIIGHMPEDRIIRPSTREPEVDLYTSFEHYKITIEEY